MATIDQHSGKKYQRLIHSAKKDNTRPPIAVDVYCVFKAFAVTCGACQHTIKKLLCAGLRDKGSRLRDLQESRDAIDRAIEMEQEDHAVDTDRA